MKRNKFITVIGNIAAGKSTLVRLLSKKMPAKEIPADSLFRVNPFFPLALNDRQRWSLASDLWFLYERVKMTRKVPKFLNKGHVVVDSGLPMSYVYAKSRQLDGYLREVEWRLYQELHDEIVNGIQRSDKVVYLKAPIELILKRIKKRNRKFELKHYKAKYLQGLAMSLQAVVGQLTKSKIQVIPVDVTRIDFVNEEQDLESLIKDILR